MHFNKRTADDYITEAHKKVCCVRYIPVSVCVCVSVCERSWGSPLHLPVHNPLDDVITGQKSDILVK